MRRRRKRGIKTTGATITTTMATIQTVTKITTETTIL